MATKILIVEDSRTQAEALRELLEGAGHAVVVATSGEEGLERFAAAPPDIVVSDIVMPGPVDGYELCRRIKATEHNGTPVVLLTSLADPMDIIRGLECGADNFFTKPYDPDHLLERLQLLLATRRARARDRVTAGIKVVFMGREFTVSAEREQILDLLVTTFEEAVRQNHELRRHEEALTVAQAQLARYAASLEARLQIILNSVPDVLFSFSGDLGEVYYVSPAARQVFACEPEQFTMEYWQQHIHPDDRQAVVQSLRHAVLTGTPQALEYRFVPQPGTVRWIAKTLMPVNGDDRMRIDGIARDITERKRREEELQASEERYRTVVEHANDWIWMLDGHGSFTFMNHQAEVASGYRLEDWKGRPFAPLVHPDDLASSAGAVEKTLAGQPQRFVARVRKANGEWLVFSVNTAPVCQGGAVVGVVGFGRDITEQRALEDQLRHAQKMEAVGRLAGGVAHDFNNLLGAMFMELDLGVADVPADHPVTETFQQVRRAAEQATTLTRQLLAFSRRQVVEPTVFSLNDLVGDSERMLRRLIGEDVALTPRLAPDLGAARADRGQVEQVLVNLVVNARDAMPEGGKLIIETSNAVLDAAYAEQHPEVQPGPYVVLTVTDTGTGMSEEVRSHLFEPFFTTKEHGKGTGLGLATSYGIVKRAGGHIGVYSEAGLGTTFRVYLPRVEATAAVQPRRTPVGTRRGTETILLVEDSALLRAAALRTLRSHGYRVLEAGDGNQALQLLAGSSDPVHLLLSDVVLPGLPGREVAERVRAARPDVRILFMSGYTDDVVAHQRLVDEGVAFLQKPFTQDTLTGKVREVLDASPSD